MQDDYRKKRTSWFSDKILEGVKTLSRKKFSMSLCDLERILFVMPEAYTVEYRQAPRESSGWGSYQMYLLPKLDNGSSEYRRLEA